MQNTKRDIKELFPRIIYLRIIDCLHPMVSPRDLVFRFIKVGRCKGRSTREKHGAVWICPAVPPFMNMRWIFMVIFYDY